MKKKLAASVLFIQRTTIHHTSCNSNYSQVVQILHIKLSLLVMLRNMCSNYIPFFLNKVWVFELMTFHVGKRYVQSVCLLYL